MGKRLCLILLILLSVSWDSYARQDDPFTSFELQIPANGRYIEYKNGSSFLYLGDTAWSLLSRLTKDEVSLYLKNRKEKGFTVIQTVILPELEAWNERLAIGVPSIVDVDSIRLHPVYLEHIDWVLEEAERLGLFIGLLPTWGDKVDKQWGKGPELFDEKNARNYGRMLGARYADVPNVIWIIGGDRGGDGKNKAIWNAMAEGIKEMDKTHLMTFHPQGEHSSSFWFHHAGWLDFNMFQSGHFQTSYKIYERLLETDRNLNPVKPVLDGEPRYEDIPIDFDEKKGRFIAYDIRKTLYQSILSGACGYTYGCNNIWQMYDAGRSPQCAARLYWYDSLDMEGCCQLHFFYTLWTQFDFRTANPLKDILIPVGRYDCDEAVAFCNAAFVICYFPGGDRWQIRLGNNWEDGRYTLQWMNPRNGKMSLEKRTEGEEIEVQLPEKGNESDWILIIKK